MDPNAGGVNVLHDGQLPADADQPERNFFFAQGSNGGRLLVDLGEATNLKQVNTYSWHPGTRGPQVYRLFAADGSAKDFSARPGKGTDPEKTGWTLIASIDTRPKQGEPGGQYGVSISDPGGTLGKFRYLLFDISRTEADDPFGNTFSARSTSTTARSTPPNRPRSRWPRRANTRSPSTRRKRPSSSRGSTPRCGRFAGSGIRGSSRCCPAKDTRLRGGLR